MTPEQEVEAWNTENKVGIKVTVENDVGRKTETVTRSKAWVVGGHSALVCVEGISGGYLLGRVKAIK